MKLKALIFDVDGTLADTEETRREAFNQAFEEQGLDWNWSKSKYAQLLTVAGCKERLTAYIKSLALEPAEHRALMERILDIHKSETDHFTQMVFAGQVPLRDGVLRLMDEARQAGVELAIASASALRNIEALLRSNLGPDAIERFRVIGAGDQVPHKKPAPDIYHWVLRELDQSADACVAIEDSANGLHSAKAAGIFTVVTPSPWTWGEDFSAADMVLPSLGSAPSIRDLEQRLNHATESQRDNP